MLDFSITDFIGAISSVALVSIAYQANDTWRREIKAKKKYDLIEKICLTIKDFKEFLNPNYALKARIPMEGIHIEY
ncbi:MAG: hypothetical protein WCF95_00210 [bacterium]